MAKRKRPKPVKSAAPRQPAFPPAFQVPPAPEPPEAGLEDVPSAWGAYAIACQKHAVVVSAMVDQHSRQRVNAADSREPSAYRAQHPPISGDSRPVVEPLGKQIPDSDGRPGHPLRVHDVLSALYRGGSINADELLAGRTFEEDFDQAGLEPLRAAKLARLPGGGVSDLSDAMLAGRERIGRAMTALGGYASPAGSACWAILGHGKTIKDFAQTTHIGQGKTLDEKVAKGTLVGGLGVLAWHYGIR